ncbi:MAG: N-6 DNA methylase [Acidimicrobiia bacterium]|nr:N-6 DNA methylase [Acidimicrobiia bacterium]
MTAFVDYQKALVETRSTGLSTEHSYRPALQRLIEEVGGASFCAVNEPVQGDYGAPDFIVERNGVPIGHIECKPPGDDLDVAESSCQLARYREGFPNLILTDYLEFRWYAEGEFRDRVRMGRFGSSGAWVGELDGTEALADMLQRFFDASYPTVANPQDLARRLAGKARLLRDSIRCVLEDDKVGNLGDLLNSYRKVLISDLNRDTFADLQAQTAAYGLFAARCVYKGPPEGFSRKSAAYAQTTPFLTDLFTRFAGPSADPRVTWIVDDLALLLARTDMEAVLKNFGQHTHQGDPVVHFYEDFLHAYDPDLREMRGVYYTPEPVVQYIVRSVDYLLRDVYGLEDGLADTATVEADNQGTPRVLILDPAAGTGTFLCEVVKVARKTLMSKGIAGAWSDYVRRYLAPRLCGFELLMAPYAICHLKLSIEIEGTGTGSVLAGQRLGVYLTNTLEEAHESDQEALFATEIAREASEADAVKRDRPVMVVVGNPPYSGHSANDGRWIRDLLRGCNREDPENYFVVDGNPLGERNPKWLNDDYVKFLRFAQWRISRTGEGILGFVTNHSYLDSPTFRGMRQSLMNTFDEIRILDLHGNAKRSERTPAGGTDENVFDIQQGVAVGLFVKHRRSKGQPARVFHADLWGERSSPDGEGKYDWLARNDVGSTEWVEIAPKSPQYFFVPRDDTLAEEYEAGWKVTEILPVNSVGIVTARDKLTIQWTPPRLPTLSKNSDPCQKTKPVNGSLSDLTLATGKCPSRKTMCATTTPLGWSRFSIAPSTRATPTTPERQGVLSACPARM